MTFEGVNKVQTALALRRFPISSIVAMFAVLLALTAGAVGGHWLKSQRPTATTNTAQAAVVRPAGQMAPPHDLPEQSANVADAVDRALAGAANVTDAVDRALARMANANNPKGGPASRTGD